MNTAMFMKVSLETIVEVDKEGATMLKAFDLKVTGIITCLRRANFSFKMVHTLKESGEMTNFLELVLFNTLVVMFIKVNGNRTSLIDMERWYIEVVRLITVNGTWANDRVMVC